MDNFVKTNTVQKSLLYLAVLAVTYNAILALVNSLLFPINKNVVVISEILILAASLAVYFSRYTLLEKDKYVVFLFLSICFSFILILISTQIVFLDGVRNFLIICVFFLVGSRLTENTLHKVFFITSCIVILFLIIEISMLSFYVKLFEPALYYQNTRGLELLEFDTIGVFGNALGFDGRFSYGIFSGPRTSSIFLEQVGLANYAIVLSLYLLVFNHVLKNKIKCFYGFLIIIICLSNETRVGSVLVFCFFIFGLLRNFIPQFSNMTMPIITVLAGFFVTGFFGDVQGDDLLGRINVGFGHFLNLNPLDYFGAGVLIINKLWDSGFGYLIATSTIVGTVAFIYFVLTIIKQVTTEGVLCALGLSMYVFINLTVSGNAIYSIKTATLLWLLVGYIYNYEIKYKITTD